MIFHNRKIFFIQYTCNELETFVFFDSLSGNSEVLIKTLETLDYTNLIDYFAIRNEYRSMSYGIVRDLNLNMIEDTNTTCYFFPKEDALQLTFEYVVKFDASAVNFYQTHF